LQKTVGLLRISDKRSLLFLGENRGLNELLPLLLEVPDKDAFGAYSPQFAIFVADIIDVFGVTDIDLMWLS